MEMLNQTVVVKREMSCKAKLSMYLLFYRSFTHAFKAKTDVTLFCTGVSMKWLGGSKLPLIHP